MAKRAIALFLKKKFQNFSKIYDNLIKKTNVLGLMMLKNRKINNHASRINK